MIALAAVESALTGAYLWSGLTLFAAAVAVAPALVTGDWRAMVPWPLLLLAAVAVGVRALGVAPETAGYVAVAALALVLVAELDAFTPVEMTRRFAIVFGVLTTMALQGLWTIAQFYSDRWFGTALLRSETELQWDLVAVTAVALVVGGAFEWYLRWTDRQPTGNRE